MSKILKALNARFDNLDTDPILKTVKLLDTKLWPSLPADDDSEVDYAGAPQNYGNTEIISLHTHFAKLLGTTNGCLDEILAEWEQLKFFVRANMTQLSNDEIWATITQHYKSKFGHIIAILNMLLHYSSDVSVQCCK